MRRTRTVAAMFVGLLAGSVASAVPAGAGADPVTRATATLANAAGAPVGTATFETVAGRTTVSVVASGLAPGYHGMHLHSTGVCDGGGGFASAGPHHNPDAVGHGDHDADLPPLFATATGEARLVAVTDRVVIADLLAGDGSALIVHASPDNLANIPTRYEQVAAPGTFGPDASTLGTGDAGARFACGVLTASGAAAAGADADAVLGAADPAGGMRAMLVDATGATRGRIDFDESGGRVEVRISATGLTPGFHGMHVHAVGLCDGGGGFASAGSHHNPDAVGHGAHDADLTALLAASDGTVDARFLTDRFTTAEVLDGDGAAVVVHAGRDNYGNVPTRYDSTDATGTVPGPDGPTLATGDAGSRFACGVLVPATGTERYVERVYGALLDRATDPSGLTFWRDQLDGGLPRSAFVRSVAGSQEAREAFCDLAYRTVLGRTPDAGGLAHFAAALAGGMTLQSLDAVLAGSAELEGTAGTDAAVVDELYRVLLDRTADAAGAAFWTASLATGTTAEQVAVALLSSTEGRGHQVDVAYRLVLEREPDAGGRSHWMQQLAAGLDRRALVEALASSAELAQAP